MLSLGWWKHHPFLFPAYLLLQWYFSQQGNQMGWRNVRKKTKKIQRCVGKSMFDTRDFLQSAWIRCGFCFSNKTYQELHRYRYYILFGSAVVFWTLFHIIP